MRCRLKGLPAIAASTGNPHVRPSWIGILFVVLLSFLVTAHPAHAAQTSYRIGVLAHEGKEKCLADWTLTAAHLPTSWRPSPLK